MKAFGGWMQFVQFTMLMSCAMLPTVLKAAVSPAPRTAPVAAVAGCRSVGPSVHCELAPPTPAPRPQPAMVANNAAPKISGAQRQMNARLIAPLMLTKPHYTAPAAAEIEQHIASLVAISDCTGARSFARSVNADDLAQKTFDSCIGLKATSPPAGSTPVSKTSTPSVDVARAGG